MRLSVEHILINPIVIDLPLRIWSMNQVTVLHHLREEERFLEVCETTAIGSVDVVDAGEARADAAGCVDGFEGVPSVLVIHYR